MANHQRNPFTPNFGSVPVWMAGRSEITNSIFSALDRGIGDPNLCALFSGARGSGKTALLTYISDHAPDHGWVAVDVTASSGMLEDIMQRTIAAASKKTPFSPLQVKGVELPLGINVSWEREHGRDPNWRTRMEALLEKLNGQGVGLLITVDEAKPSVGEMIRLSQTYQHFVRERRNVALLMAGLPHDVDSLVSNEDVSFLRRAARHRIGNVSQAEAQIALRRTIELGDRSIGGAALATAAEATLGYPYLMQLVGFHSWDVGAPSPYISESDVRDGIALAQADFKQRVLDATYRTLSAVDIRFLEAMLPDEGNSTLSDVAARMGVRSNYASRYRIRLEEQGIISERRRGVVGFDLPLFKEYVADMAD